MDQEFSTLVETAKRLALLAETLERRSEAAAAQHQQAVQALDQALARMRGDVDRVIVGADTRIGQAARGAVDAALAEGAGRYDRSAAGAAARLDGLGEAIARTRQSMGTDMRRLAWVSYAAVAGAVVLLAAGGLGLIHIEYRAYREAQARADAAGVSAELAEAYARVNLTSCGGKPCVKLDGKARRWGRDGEYVILDGVPDGKDATRR